MTWIVSHMRTVIRPPKKDGILKKYLLNKGNLASVFVLFYQAGTLIITGIIVVVMSIFYSITF